MNSLSAHASDLNHPLSIYERWASLLGRVIIYFIMIYVPLVFFTWTWRHYHVPKVASFQWLVMMLTACWGVIAVKRRCVRSALATPAAFFFMIVMITSLVSVNLTEAWETITFMVAAIVFMILVPKFLTRYKDFEIFAYLLGIMCILVDLYALGQWFDWDQMFVTTERLFGIRKLTHKPVSFMGNENYTAEFLNMALPICFAMMFCYRRKPAQLIFYTFVTLINCIVMVYIDCNATFAGFIVAIPVATVLIVYFKMIPWSRKIGLFQAPRVVLEKRFRQLIIVLLLGFSLMAVLGTIIPNPAITKMASMASWMDVDGDLIPDGVAPIVFRLQCMDAAARNIIDAPFQGIGAGNFKVLHPLYESQLERKVLGEETLARKVHNDHLYHAVEFGALGLLGWYWIATASFLAILASLRLVEYQSIAAAQKEKKTDFYSGLIFSEQKREFYFYLQWGILTALLVALVSCAFGHTFVISSSAVIYWLLCGICVAVYQNLLFASRGIRNHIIGITPEPVNPVQKHTRRLPGFLWWVVFFIAILPVGVLNTYQLIGETWLRHGMTEREDENYYGMFKCFKESLNYYPYQMETFYILGRYYIDAVVDTETAVLGTSPGSQINLPMGLNPEDRRKYNEEGIVILQTDLFLNPNYKWAHNNLGVLYDRYYDLIKPEKQDSLGALFNVAPEPDQAIAVLEASRLTYKRVLAIDKEQIYAHFNLGLGAIKEQNYPQAIESLNQALITDPSRYDIYKYLSNCYCQNRDYRRAVRAAEKYLEKVLLNEVMRRVRTAPNPTQFESIVQNLRDNNYARAVDMARLTMKWEDKDVYNLFLAVATELSADNEKANPAVATYALEMAQRVNATPQPENYLWHAKIYERLQNMDKAADAVEEYLRVQPNDDEMRHSLMMLCVQMNDLQRAQSVMAVLVKRQPDNWQYLITYARLLSGVQTPWVQIFPYVERAIQIGGDDARRLIIENQPGNLILPYVQQDSRILNLLGSDFLPASVTQSATE